MMQLGNMWGSKIVENQIKHALVKEMQKNFGVCTQHALTI